ncbi:YmdB family metallophosphoesterase, partial [Patescibacteria group bacterium]|nr:YmdB family metallophosphoesterase [Patescibacteria group bacterium]
MKDIKVLFIGDVVGKIGRKAVAKILPKLKKQLKPDLVIANAENVAHGIGVTESTLKELMEAGVDYFSNGDHAFDKLKQSECYEKMPIIRPANYPPGVPGQGFIEIDINKN